MDTPLYDGEEGEDAKDDVQAYVGDAIDDNGGTKKADGVHIIRIQALNKEANDDTGLASVALLGAAHGKIPLSKD